MQRIIVPTSELPAAAARELTDLLNGANPVLLLLSGGSALAPLRLLGARPEATIAILDDRISDDPAASNYLQLTELGMRPDFDSRLQPGESAEQLAGRFATFLHQWRGTYPTGRVIITQGIGPDGHTAGVFPLADATRFTTLYENEAWTVTHGYGAPYPERLTVTLTFLRTQVDALLLYVGGENKREVLEKALNQNSHLHEVPAAIVQTMREVRLLTDLA